MLLQDLAKNVIKSRLESKDRDEMSKSIDDLNEKRINDRITREQKERLLGKNKRFSAAIAPTGPSESSEKVLYIILKSK